METVKGTAEQGAGRAERRKGEIQEGTPAPLEPNREAHLVGGGSSGVCTAAASDS